MILSSSGCSNFLGQKCASLKEYMKFMIYRVMVFFCFLLIFLPISCSNKKSDDLAKASEVSVEDGHPFKEKVIIALPPEINIFEQTKKYQPIEEYLQETLKLDFKFKVVESYGAIIRELAQEKVEGAFLGSLNYFLARNQATIEVIARPQWPDGTSSYTGLIFTHKNSGLTRDVATWKNKTFAMVHQATTAGYLFPRWHLLKAGMKDWKHFFNKVVLVGSHDAAIFMVVNRETELGVAKNSVFKKLVKDNPSLEDSLVILAESMPVPSNAFVIRKNSSPQLKNRIKEALLQMDGTNFGREKLDAFGALKFLQTTDADYEPIAKMLQDLQLESSNPLFTLF